MPIFNLFILLFTDIICGLFIIHNFKISKKLQILSLSIILGMFQDTFIIFLLELIQIKFTPWLFLSIKLILSALILKIYFKNLNLAWLKNLFNFNNFKIRPSEYVFILCFIFLIGATFWRCIYSIPISYDTMVGIDLVAKYGALEGHISNSFYNELIPNNSFWSNQGFYAPFTMISQLIYRLIGFDYGQVWLAIFTLCFFTFFYSKLKEYSNSFISSILTLILIATPEFYAYTFIVQTDFSNAVFFSISIFYFHEFVNKKNIESYYFSILLMFAAVWTRSETIFFTPFGSLLYLFLNYKKNIKKAFINASLFTIIPLIAFVLWNFIFLKLYIPIAPNNANMLILNFENYLQRVYSLIKEMNSFIFAESYWGYTVNIFIYGSILIILYDIFKTKNFKNYTTLYFLFVLHFVFIFMLMHIKDVAVPFTFRRGFFKYLPIMIFFIGTSNLFTTLFYNRFLKNTFQSNNTKK